MKVTALYVYPIKALRGIPLTKASLTAQGIRHDRRFMLFEAHDGKIGKKMQIDSHTQCGLFAQEFGSIAAPNENGSPGAEADAVVVRYLTPKTPVAPPHPLQASPLTVPLEPDVNGLERIDVNLHGSPASVAYRMGDKYDAWFSACFGSDVMLVYLGDGHREVLGETLIPPSMKEPQSQQQPQAQQGWPGWVASLSATLTGRAAATQPRNGAHKRPTIAFSDVAPFLVVSEASVRDVSARLPSGVDMDVRKFRPNIVLDGEEAWAEDFWGDVEITAGSNADGATEAEGSKTRLVLTANCARCVSLNVDYETGRPAAGELGAVLKTLMKDRRVDKGSKWSPIFGRYGFLDGVDEGREIRVGDEVSVTRRLEERTTWDWDIP